MQYFSLFLSYIIRVLKFTIKIMFKEYNQGCDKCLLLSNVIACNHMLYSLFQKNKKLLFNLFDVKIA